MALVAAVALGGFAARAQAQSTEPTPPAYTASASADGVRIRVALPGAPLTDIPVDAGGPTAQVLGNSLGTSQAYAALPDPGEVVLHAPGLATGLLSLGAAGLPPINLPTLPSYPLYVQSDAQLRPEQQVGSGPYELRATSRQGASSAVGSAGLQTEATGRVGLVRSTAELTEEGDTVTVRATSTVEALTVGPLTLGNVTATAGAVIAADGTVTPTSSLRISGARVGGVPIDLTDQGLDLAGTAVPLDLFGALAPILRAAGIELEIIEATQGEGQVTAAALEVTVPFQAPGVGSGAGTMTMVLGGASASIEGVAPAPPVDDQAGAIDGDLGSSAADLPSLGDGGAGFAPIDTPGVPSALTPGGRSTPVDGVPVVSDRLVNLFDVGNVYLLLSGAAAVAFVLSLLVSLIGARPWRTSSAG